MPPPEYGRSLDGLTLNFLVTDMERAVEFHTNVLGVDVVYSDPDITIVRGFGTRWMLHADHTYDQHAMLEIAEASPQRGAGLEMRLHMRDPDDAVAEAGRHGFEVLDGPRDQPDHGLREAHIVDQDGYIWVPDVPLA